jgi:hypothetical protein
MDQKTQEIIWFILIILLAAFWVYSWIWTQKPSQENNNRVQYEKGEIDRSEVDNYYPDSGPRD